MEDVHTRKSVTFGGMRTSRTYTRIAQRHVEKWIERERALAFLAEYTGYSIHIEKESRTCFTCHIEIRTGAREWTGLSKGLTVQEAILSALRFLAPKDRIELYHPPVLSPPRHEMSA